MIEETKDQDGNSLFHATSRHCGEAYTFFSRGAAVFWLWLRDEYYGSLAIRGKLPEGYFGPAKA